MTQQARGKREICQLPSIPFSLTEVLCVGVRAHVHARLVAQFCLTLCDPMDSSPPGYLCPWGFSRQEHCSGLPCPPPGEHPDPRIEPRSPIFQVDSLQSEPPRKPLLQEGTWQWSMPCSIDYRWGKETSVNAPSYRGGCRVTDKKTVRSSVGGAWGRNWYLLLSAASLGCWAFDCSYLLKTGDTDFIPSLMSWGQLLLMRPARKTWNCPQFSLKDGFGPRDRLLKSKVMLFYDRASSSLSIIWIH